METNCFCLLMSVQRCQSVCGRDCCKDREKVEGSSYSLENRNLTEAQGHSGCSGSLARTQDDLASRRQRQRLVQEEVRASVEEEWTSRAMAMRQQGAWMKWEQAMERSVTWKNIWHWNPQRIKFLIQGAYDVLPSPSNLFTLGKIEKPTFPLCSKAGTLEHILRGCPKALGEGRYWWRHDQVLKSIAEAISGYTLGSLAVKGSRLVACSSRKKKSLRRSKSENTATQRKKVFFWETHIESFFGRHIDSNRHLCPLVRSSRLRLAVVAAV